MIHGGDIYRNRVKTDFSVNTNPSGTPESVRAALVAAAGCCDTYPDPDSEELCSAIAESLRLPEDAIVCGNGASELFLAAVHALKPKKTLLPVPSFYGYERAAAAAGSDIIYVNLREENDFMVGEELLSRLTDDIDLLFLANPNNPTGALIQPELLRQIADRCLTGNIRLILDECFLELTGEEEKYSFLRTPDAYPNVLLIRAFTKLYAIPGVRLGYLVCSDVQMVNAVRAQLAEWNVSVFAQKAGIAALKETEYVRRSAAFVREEREWLSRGLVTCGCHVFPSKANYVLFRTELPLYEKLLEKELLIRDCSSFHGLTEGYFRVAVRCREENSVLLAAIRKIGAEHGKPVEFVLPDEIEKRSFEIITEECKERGIVLPASEEGIVKRVIHTSADFSYAETMTFSPDAVRIAKELLGQGADIVTDTNMALAGINKRALAQYGGTARCFMADEETARLAGEQGKTRAAVSMERAAQLEGPVIFAVGNAPTALIQLYEMIKNGSLRPAFIIGVPVGFVNVEAAKELILKTDVPYIINRGRKGGSNIAAAICNAILYQMRDDTNGK